MRALSLTGPEAAELVAIDPPQAGGDEALVEPRWVGLCGTDLELFLGTMPYFRAGVASYPIQPGHEVAGVVIEAPADGGPAAGTPVVIDPVVGCGGCAACASGIETHCSDRRELGVRLGMPGGAAELIAVPVRKLHPVPAGVALRDAVLVEPAVTVLNGLDRVGDADGVTALVIGAGTLGLIAAQLLRSRGAAVDVLIDLPARVPLIESIGARPVEAIEPAAYGIVLEAAGTPAAVRGALAAASAGGQIALMGVQPDAVDQLDVNELVLRDVTLHGVLNGPGRFGRVLDEIARGALEPSQLIDGDWELGDAGAALARLREPSREAPKVLLRIGES